MKLVILAGGRGTRITEETLLKPKPLVEIGNMPIIWHIMKHYSYYGINDFIICCGYKGYLIKEYFANYSLHSSDATIDIFKNSIKVHRRNTEKWKITLLDTGEKTLTGGRILKTKKYVSDPFLLTYGDGLSNVNIKNLIKFHKSKNKLATMTVVKLVGRFGMVKLDEKKNIKSFIEKPKDDDHLINGGFFVLSKKIFNLLKDENTIWEKSPLEKLSKQSQLVGYEHKGFWYAMDNIRDKIYLDELWEKNVAPWKTWND